MYAGRRGSVVLVLVALVCTLLISIVSAAYAADLEYVGSWGTFNGPRGIDRDAAGNLYVADMDNHRVQKLDSSGNVLASWGSLGSGPAQLNSPRDVALDSAGNIYVADYNNHRVVKLSPTGTYLSQLGTGSAGTADGVFNSPVAVAVDSAGDVYVADYLNHRIQKFSGSGTFISKWGGTIPVTTSSADGRFHFPRDIVVGPEGVYVPEHGNHRVQQFTTSGVFVRKWGTLGSAVGQFDSPRGVAIGPGGNVFIADFNNNRVQEFTSSGVFVSQIGAGAFNGPVALVFGPEGQMYVVDQNANRVQVWSAPTPPPVVSTGASSAWSLVALAFMGIFVAGAYGARSRFNQGAR
jgi:tripartite motif-containing protein 71